MSINNILLQQMALFIPSIYYRVDKHLLIVRMCIPVWLHVSLFPGPSCLHLFSVFHDDVIKWIHFPRYWTFVWGIHRSPVNSPHKGQWRRALMYSFICVWIKGWVNNREAGDLIVTSPQCFCRPFDGSSITISMNFVNYSSCLYETQI